MLTILRKIICYLFTIVFVFTPGFFDNYDNRKETLESVKKVSDGFYMMDYTYDYDIDELLSNGISTHVTLILEAVKNTVFADLPGCGCSTFNSVTDGGDYLFSRNFDYMDSDLMLVWTHPSNGYASVSAVSLMFLGYDESFSPDSFTDSIFTLLAPYAPLDGINEKGLTIGILELENDPVFQTTEKKNLTTTTMIRAVLDKAATVEEAIEIFKSYDMRDLLVGECTYHYQISDAQGKSVIIEYVDGEINLIYPESRTESTVKYQAATNFYITQGVSAPEGMGHDRYETIYKALDNSYGVTSESEAMDILKSVSMKDADLHGFICSTLWSTVYNTEDCSVSICAQGDYNKVYSFTLDNPLVYQTTQRS